MSSYKDSGVDIEEGNKSVDLIKRVVSATYSDAVVLGVGGFGSAFSLKSFKGFEEPLLVSTIDGVGTKLKVAAMVGKWGSIGVDIVNHCSNDLVALGAKPLFFLDYVASSKISANMVFFFFSGMASACKEIGCSLVGGETAEMPGVYVSGESDVVGCMVGVVDKSKLIDGSKIRSGDVLIGLASNGLHTNGFSLARKVLFEDAVFGVNDFVEELGCTIGEELLKVHKSYSNLVLELLSVVEVKGVAHVTGGGLCDNLSRIVPKY